MKSERTGLSTSSHLRTGGQGQAWSGVGQGLTYLGGRDFCQAKQGHGGGAVTVHRVGTMMRVVGVRGVQGRGPRRSVVPGTLGGPGAAAAAALLREQGLVFCRLRLVLEAVPAGAAAGPGPAAAPRPIVGAPRAGLGGSPGLPSAPPHTPSVVTEGSPHTR